MLPILISLLTVSLSTLAAESPETRSNLFVKTGGDGKSLPYLKRKTTSTKGEIECARECVQDSSCGSFNIGPPDDTVTTSCELNFDTHRDSGIELEEKADWSYYEGQIQQPSTGGVTASAYDPLHKWWFLAFGNTLFQFPELEHGVMTFQHQTSLGGHDVEGMLVLNSSTMEEIHLRCYLGDGTVANGTLDVNDTFSLTITPLLLDIHDLHGPEIEGDVRDVINFNGTLYIFAGNTTYAIDPDQEDVVVQAFGSYNESVPENPFYAMPREITAATELTYPKLMFFKGRRIYWFDGEKKRVTAGSYLNGG